PPGTARRAATLVVFDEPHAAVLPAKARAGGRRSAYAQPRSAGLAGRARSAPQALTRGICSNAANAVSVVSYAAGLQDRASQGTLAQRGQASKRSRLPARAFARSLCLKLRRDLLLPEHHALIREQARHPAGVNEQHALVGM